MKPIRFLAPVAAICTLAISVSAADFSIEISNPAAAQIKIKKSLNGFAVAVRSQGCDDPGKFRVEGNSIQPAGGSRAIIPLLVSSGGVRGLFLVSNYADLRGMVWLMALTADCKGAKAGALVPVDENGTYNREASKFSNHAPTAKEIDEALKALIRK